MKYAIEEATLTDIAKAIRSGKGTTDLINPTKFAEEITALTDRFRGVIDRSATHVDIPSGTTAIGNDVFRNCVNLESVTIPDGVTSIGEYAFYQCTALASADISDSVLTIGENAFRKCAFTEMPVMNGVTTIGDNSFRLCPNLTSIVLPDSLKSIGDSAFQTCSAVIVMTSGSGLTNIGQQVFRDFTNCLVFDFSKCENIPTLSNSNAFSGINAYAKIIVPGRLYSRWIAATNWVNLKDYIIYPDTEMPYTGF